MDKILILFDSRSGEKSGTAFFMLFASRSEFSLFSLDKSENSVYNNTGGDQNDT